MNKRILPESNHAIHSHEPLKKEFTMEERFARIEQYRTKIDNIDRQLATLLTRRAEYACLIGRLKKAANLPVYDREREKQVLANVRRSSPAGFDTVALQRIFKVILSVCLEMQHSTNRAGNGTVVRSKDK